MTINEKDIEVFKKKTAVVILAYADYESLELTLAAHTKFTPKDIKIFILQNGRGSFDCERTYQVAKRYQQLNPMNMVVVDTIPPGIPYFSLKTLFAAPEFSQFEYIIKMDDDVFPLTSTWVEDLCKCYLESEEEFGSKLAYVSSLVNNNPFGFKKILDIFNLWEEYKNIYSRDHFVGIDKNSTYNPYRLIKKGGVSAGGFGTIWCNPYLARWIHEKISLNPDFYVQKTKNLGYEEFNAKERYSINCLLFKKNLWFEIDDGGSDDEFMLQKYCLRNAKKCVINLAIPMVHLFFYSQRLENKDLIDKFRSVYTKWLGFPFPISICQNKLYDIEERVKFLEKTRGSVNTTSLTTGNVVRTKDVKRVLKLYLRRRIQNLFHLNN